MRGEEGMGNKWVWGRGKWGWGGGIGLCRENSRAMGE